jgi:methylisocitrate lyase
MSTSAGQRLRESIEQGPIAVPGVFNALVMKMVARQGFRAAYLSGAAFSAGTLGIPDVGLFTLTELVDETRRLAHATDVPLIVDADTGFGEAINVTRTIQELVRAGAAGVQLEDQELPKRCGHLSGKSLVSREAMCQKIRAAVDARGDGDLVIIARTDARGVNDLDDAIERARSYRAAGADWIFPEALASRDDFRRFAEAVEGPLVANMTEFGKSPLLTVEELGQLGYRAVLFPVTLMRVAMHAVQECLRDLSGNGTQRDWLERMQSRAELYDLIGYENYVEKDREHFGR